MGKAFTPLKVVGLSLASALLVALLLERAILLLALRLFLAFSLWPMVAGIGAGGVLGNTVEHLKNFVEGVPQMGPALGGFGGMALMGPLSLLAKWSIRRLWAKGEEARYSRTIAQARAREAQAWAQVQLQRLHHAVQQALARLTAFLARPSIPADLRSLGQQAQADMSSLLTLPESGFPNLGAVKGFAPREGLFTARLASTLMPCPGWRRAWSAKMKMLWRGWPAAPIRPAPPYRSGRLIDRIWGQVEAFSC